MITRLSDLFILTVAVIAFVQLGMGDELPVLVQGDLHNGTIVKTDYYSGKALFGYIDGGAELYLEYKFQKLGRQEIRVSNETIIVEIYQMQGPYEAYGVFSINRFKCVPVDSTSLNTCQTRYQLQAVVGPCYLSIVNESGTSDAQTASFEVYKAIKLKVQPLEISLPAMFRAARLRPYLGRLITICGTLGVQNGFAEWEGLFQGINGFWLTVLPIEDGRQQLTVAHIRFISTQDASAFCALAGFADAAVGSLRHGESGGIIRSLKRANNIEVLVVESPRSFPHRENYLSLLID